MPLESLTKYNFAAMIVATHVCSQEFSTRKRTATVQRKQVVSMFIIHVYRMPMVMACGGLSLSSTHVPAMLT